jgi:NADH dehydrogenase [ubiquinone] 1 alpha subcomplex assembly factor 1
MDPYAYLALRVKSDGRRYTVNVQTDSIVETDIHQHRLYTRHHKLDPHSAPHATSSSSPDTPAALADFPPQSPSSLKTTSSATSTAPSTGWETILIKWSDFVRTNYGTVVEPQTGMITQRVKSIGIGLTDRVEGPFELCIQRMWATNGMTADEIEEERRICGADALDVSVGANLGGPGWAAEETLVEREGKKVERLRGLKGLKDEWEK